MDLDEVLNGRQAETVEAQPQQQEAQLPAEGGGEGAPTASQGQEQHVPLAALEAERKTRQDWKERAIRHEEETKRLREQLEQIQRQPQQQFQPQQLDPLQSVQQQLINERFNTSEMLVKQAHADADEVVGVFMEAAKANPALAAALHQQRHPWDFAYKEGKRLLMLKEVGDDPAAYRAKVEAEIRAQLQSQAQPQVQLPQSLNGARSVAPRNAPAWTGPTPISDLFR